jgi:HTH-type transcriptional regulator/antitoxin HigA
MSNQYRLDYAVHPGEYIDELLAAREMSQADLALRMHVSTKHLNQIIKGKANVSASTAMALEAVLDRSAQYWLSLQAKYDEYSAREKQAADLLAEKEWVSSFDYTFLAEAGFVPKTDNLVEKGLHLLRFFEVASVDAWKDVWCMSSRDILREGSDYEGTEVALTTSSSLAVWIRMGQMEAEQIVPEYPAYHSQKLSRSLSSLRSLTFLSAPEEIVAAANEHLKGAGVFVQYVRPVKGLCSYAASFMIRSGQVACIQLSDIVKTGDQLISSLFQEIAHLQNRGNVRRILVGITNAAGVKSEIDNSRTPLAKYSSLSSRKTLNVSEASTTEDSSS